MTLSRWELRAAYSLRRRYCFDYPRNARIVNAGESGDYSYLENAVDFQTPRVFENPWGLEIRIITRSESNSRQQKHETSPRTFPRSYVARVNDRSHSNAPSSKNSQPVYSAVNNAA